MIELGKSMFRINAIQVSFIGLSLGLAILAKYLSIEQSHMSLSNFISSSFDNLFSNKETFSIWINVFLPGVLYIISSLLLLWMSITNLTTLHLEEKKIDIGLKILLAVFQVALFGWFLFVGGKLIIYYSVLALLCLFSIAFIVSAFTSSRQE
ncbi:hypothetical protein M4D55_00105 [Metabacillus idriensis]|uniref:hypothetical protein n=1 Tax=Metabacillus idriensis TaxID=324768 RepID=UPI0020421D35|nr:hypothetical protein [Metabacillus idriensis]MCM3594184.1 hypothetical protein [Metabacillus idriensis]